MAVPVFFINMASRPDRLAHVARQLEACGLPAERVEAVTPADFPPDLQRRYDAGGMRLSAGELACSLSHRKVWQLMRARGIAAALILEDDVLLASSVGAVLNDPLLLGNGAEAIQFETHRTAALVGRPMHMAVPGITRNRLMSSSLGTAAYVMTAGLAGRLLPRDDLDTMPIDELLFSRRSGLLYEARIFQIVPALAIQLDFTAAGRRQAAQSDLTPQRLSAPSGRALSLRAGLRRRARHWGNHLRVVATFGASGELWGARHLRLPVTADLQQLL